MICTVRMGDNDMRKMRVHTKLVPNFSVHPRRLFLCSKCNSVVVLNGGVDFRAINFQTNELKAPESCHFSRNGLYVGMVLFGNNKV